jgi:tetratricopeptide (TPR) repeat protein
LKNRLESLLELYEKDPSDSFLIYGIALEYISLKELDKAEEYLKNLLEKDPAYVPGFMQLGRILENKNKIKEAKTIYIKGIEAAKKSGDRKSANEMEDFLDDLN